MSWSSIKGYDGVYKVCEDGHIKRIDSGKILKPAVAKNGYLIVSLWKNNKGKSQYVHRILAETFLSIPKSKDRLTVNHIDGNKLNNTLQNLEWCSYSANNQHAYDTGLKVVSEESRRKTSSRMRIRNAGNNYRGLAVSQYDLTGNFVQTYSSVEEAAKSLNIHRRTIDRNAKGRIQNPKWWIFKYEEEKYYGNE